MRKTQAVILCSVGVILLSAMECFCAWEFGQHEVAKVSTSNRPTVTFTRPADHEANVLPNIYVSCDVNLPNVGAGGEQRVTL